MKYTLALLFALANANDVIFTANDFGTIQKRAASPLQFAKLNGVSDIKPSTPLSFCTQFKVSEAAGQQQRNGGIMCSSTPQGVIPDINAMVTSMIMQPAPQAKLSAAAGFKIQVMSRNFMAGNFIDIFQQYLLTPQTVDPATGMVQGFMQIVLQPIPTDGTAPSANRFTFFAAFGTKSDANGQTTINFQVPANAVRSRGEHRICSIPVTASGIPVIMPVAQRGAQGDCIRVNIGN